MIRPEETGETAGSMLSVCVYADSTDLFSEEKSKGYNMCYLDFPEQIVRSWYEKEKKEFDEATSEELGIDVKDCTFDQWYKLVYTADDTDGLFWYAKENGFTADRETAYWI